MARVSLKQARRSYAEELRAVALIRPGDAVIEAFATVPRERFLGPGPWTILPDGGKYYRAADADPRRVYHNVLIAIDRKRGLNNGSPSWWAGLFERLAIKRGDRVMQIGAGTGYYSAILAALVGRRGHVVAIEYDRGLARRARANLKPWPQVEVVHGDGMIHDPGPVDVVVAFAGGTHPSPIWLDRLAPSGRLMMPMTAETGWGFMLHVVRRRDGFTASSPGPVGFFPCVGRDARAGKRLLRALRRLRGQRVPPIIALHRGTPSARQKKRAWYAGPGFWLEAPPPKRKAS
jgi:protein-L-isoaspartate(D-aspartate) O-methyltransferase